MKELATSKTAAASAARRHRRETATAPQPGGCSQTIAVLQPSPSMRHLETNRYPMCPVSLAYPPGVVLRRVSPAIIDTCGNYPFLLFRLRHNSSGLSVHCVRGSASFPGERAIDSLYSELLGANFSVQVEGGGAIKFSDDSVQIHGASAAYGRSDHHLVGKLIKFCYPGLKVQYEPDSPLQQKQALHGTRQLLKAMEQNSNKASTKNIRVRT